MILVQRRRVTFFRFPPKFNIFINLIKSPRMGKAAADARMPKIHSQIEIEKHFPMQIINMQKRLQDLWEFLNRNLS